jgi:hypothetical protein
MMSRLRSQCDTMDHKNTALVDSQLEKYMQEIQASIAAIFDKSPATIKGKSKLFAEFEHNPKTMHLSKYVLEHAESRGKEHGDTPGRASKLRRLSSKGSLVAGSVENPYQTWNSGTPSALKSSQYLPKDTFYSGLPQGTDGRRMKQSLASGTTRAGEVLDIISNDKVHFSSNLDEFQQKIFKKLKSKKPIVAAKPCVHEETDDPLESINKKLAAFNLRQRSREMNRTFQPPSSDLRQNDWLSKRPDDLYDLPLETCTGFLESHTPNIKDLRDFRQKMRERYMKEQLAANKSRMVYCTH